MRRFMGKIQITKLEILINRMRGKNSYYSLVNHKCKSESEDGEGVCFADERRRYLEMSNHWCLVTIFGFCWSVDCRNVIDPFKVNYNNALLLLQSHPALLSCHYDEAHGCPGFCPPAPQSSWSHPEESSQRCPDQEILVSGWKEAKQDPKIVSWF